MMPPQDAPGPLVARARQPLWPILVLLPTTPLLVWMVFQSFAPDFAAHSPDALVTAAPPMVRAVFFGFCAAVCVLGLGLALWRRLFPQVEFILGDTEMTSRLFWGAGTLAYASVRALTRRGNWLYISGVDARGHKRRLIVNVAQLDQPESLLTATLDARIHRALGG